MIDYKSSFHVTSAERHCSGSGPLHEEKDLDSKECVLVCIILKTPKTDFKNDVQYSFIIQR
jgi:hypothetical protein